MDQYLEIHASSLPDYLDCPRRAIIRALHPTFERSGFKLPPRQKTAAAGIGTSLHKMMQELFRQKKVHGDLNIEAAYQKQLDEFKTELGDCKYSDLTPHFDGAEAQLKALMRSFIPIAEMTDPLDVETTLQCDFSPLGALAIPIRLIGTRDLKDKRKEIHDHKSGAKIPKPQVQLGAYSLLEKAHDGEVSALRMNWAPVQPLSKLNFTQARSLRFDIDDCEKAAWTAIKEVQRHYHDYIESNDVSVIPANNKSMFCTVCQAYNTTYCTLGCVE